MPSYGHTAWKRVPTRLSNAIGDQTKRHIFRALHWGRMAVARGHFVIQQQVVGTHTLSSSFLHWLLLLIFSC
jgi:hypothetical protein